MTTITANKAKIARRVVEVLEFFDEKHQEATVMDLVRRYDRPQSSTSELLSSLVELGILYKDSTDRTYRPTPRAALLGTQTQCRAVRDGRLVGLMERLRAQTGLPVALFGLVGVEVQVFARFSAGRDRASAGDEKLAGGQSEKLTDSVAGQLLMAALSRPQRAGIVRRLNAEAKGDFVPFGEMIDLIDRHERYGRAFGPAGFGTHAELCVELLPAYETDRPLAVGLLVEQPDKVDREALAGSLTSAIRQLFDGQHGRSNGTPFAAVA